MKQIFRYLITFALALLWSFQTHAQQTSQSYLYYYIVDKSGSINGNNLQKPISSALLEHFRSLPPRSTVRVFFFDDRSYGPETFISGDNRKLQDHINRQFQPSGNTRLFDTVGLALDDALSVAGNFDGIVFAVFSDGGNNRGNYDSWDDLKSKFEQLQIENPNSFTYWLTVGGFKPKNPPPGWVRQGTEVKVPEPEPNAAFGFHPKIAKPGEQVAFYHNGRGGRIDNMEWSISGTSAGSGRELRHTFHDEGDYPVALSVSGPGGSDRSSIVYSVKFDSPLTASFVRAPEGRLRIGDSVTFLNTSSGDPESIKWLVNGIEKGTGASFQTSFEKPGNYTVRLEASRTGTVETQEEILSVLPPQPDPSFSIEPANQVDLGDPVRFVASATGAGLDHRWKVAGDVELTGPNPDWTPDREGLLTVIHIIEGPGGTAIQKEALSVNSILLAQPIFSSSSRKGTAPLEVSFRDESKGEIASYQWDFGDGASSSEQNPTHIYVEPGNYSASLTVTNLAGKETTAPQPVIIQVHKPLPAWIKWLVVALVVFLVWVLLVVPIVLTPLFGLAATKEKGRGFSLTSETGGKNYMHTAAKKGSPLRYLWPKSSASVGTGKKNDIRLTVAQKSGPDQMASIKREPFSKRFRITPNKGATITKVQPGVGGTETETPLKSSFTPKHGQILSFSGARYHWESPNKK